jgi:hypothetical protein
MLGVKVSCQHACLKDARNILRLSLMMIACRAVKCHVATPFALLGGSDEVTLHGN